LQASDKDLYQLVNENINQLDMKGKLYDVRESRGKMGVKPHQIRDLLALTGDFF
jgi:5'-3' exonuclease